MRPALVMLAALAGSALAYPTDMATEKRTFGLLAEILGHAAVDVSSILEAVLSHGHSSGSLLAGLSAEGAAALEGGALGCKAGAIHAHAKAALKAWLLIHAQLDFSLKKHLIAWCDGDAELVLSADILAALSAYIPGCAEVAAKGQLYVTIDGIFAASSLESALVLSLSAQASLSAWIEAKVGLDVGVKAGLGVCAAGGVIGSLSADIKASLLAWVNSSKCDLSAELKVSVLAWINGHAGGQLVELGSLGANALSTVSIGASVGVHVEEAGHLSVGGKASLAAFLDASVSASIGADVQLGLQAAAKGELATSVELDVRTQLAIWLSGSDCTLGVELKSVVLLWLSFAVEADASVSLNLVGGLLGHVTGFLSETVLAGLSVDLRGALSLCAAGGSIADLTFGARAELAAFLGGSTDIDINLSIQIIFLQWFTGCSIPGAPTPTSSVPSLPSSTPYKASTSAIPSGPGASISVSVPSGPAPSGPAGSVSVSIPGGPAETPSGVSPTGTPIPSGPAETPSGVSPTGTPVPSGPAETTPCDTETSEVVRSTVIPGPSGSGSITVTIPVVPTGTAPAQTPSGPAPSGPAGSVSVPSGPAPSGPAGSASVSIPGGPAETPSGVSPTGTPVPSGPAETTPCDTETSEVVRSTVIPGPSGSGSITVTIPAVPTGTAPAQTPSGPAATTPCDTETSGIVGSTVIPGVPAETPSGVSPTGTPVPSGPADTTPCDTCHTETTEVVASTVITGVPAPSGTAPAETPCDTETSDIVGSTVIPGVPGPSGPAGTTPAGSVPAQTPTGVAPTGTPAGSGPAPSGPAPSGPAATTPCDTETSGIVGSTVIPGVPAETPSGVSPTGTPVPSGPAESTPCDTETSDIVGSTVIPGVPAQTPSGVSPTGVPVPSGPAASGPVPSGPQATGSVPSAPCETESSPAPTSPPTVPSGGGSGQEVVTVTATVTATVCGCE
ncbi:unnamed protein product [Penicillium salamii]|nr:unnamed protein product [Penicillium salamii]CAG7991738.1 unnamed protein product [Penicillium salamii]CAG8271728.1 unnamed protein product [Penicillium salamii]CAG8354733.1 unnamed protein product [Penicillium salamii]CAG8358096.1 unnamed protein product [Penicillium salamii]